MGDDQAPSQRRTDPPETLTQARTWERVKSLYLNDWAVSRLRRSGCLGASARFWLCGRPALGRVLPSRLRSSRAHRCGCRPNRGQYDRRGTVEGVSRSSARADAIGPGSLAEPAGALPLRVPSPLQELRDDRLAGTGVRVLLKRDDLINPDVPGNKWRKLKYNLAEAKRSGHRTLLTFGGAYSNHIRATAAGGSSRPSLVGHRLEGQDA
jgi:hypothetical protein